MRTCSIIVIMRFVSLVFSMEINRRLYFWSNLYNSAEIIWIRSRSGSTHLSANGKRKGLPLKTKSHQGLLNIPGGWEQKSNLLGSWPLCPSCPDCEGRETCTEGQYQSVTDWDDFCKDHLTVHFSSWWHACFSMKYFFFSVPDLQSYCTQY